MKTKGHWPSGKRRHPQPPDWARIKDALDEAARRRQSRLLAREIGVHVDTIRNWRKGIDVPHPKRIDPMVKALYALKLYWVRAGRIK